MLTIKSNPKKIISSYSKFYSLYGDIYFSTVITYGKRHACKCLTPSYAGSLWQVVVSSPAMNKVLALNKLSETSKGYLQALAEAYGKAHGWEARQQILSIISAIAFYSDIARYIPRFTRYHFTISNLHRLELSHGKYLFFFTTYVCKCRRSDLE